MYNTLISYLIGGSGAIGIFYTIYTARMQKKKIQVEITQMITDEWKELFDNFKKDASDKINSLENKIYKLELKDELKTRAINQYIKCPFPKKGNNCPVATYIESADEVLQRKISKEQIAKLNG